MRSTETKAMTATRTVRGFHTPAASGDEDSDYNSGFNTPRPHTHTPKPAPTESGLKDMVSNNTCAMVRQESNQSTASSASPTKMSGIGHLLRQELQNLNLDGAKSRSQSFVNGVKDRFKKSSPGSSTGYTTPDKSDSDSGERTYEVTIGASGGYDYIANGRFPTWDERDNYGADFGVPLEPGEYDPELLNTNRKMSAADFEPLRCLGKGTFGTVHLVRQISTGRLFAQKQFKKATLIVHTQQIEQTKTERTILENINRHPFIVKLYYAFQDQAKLYLILEYAQGGELFTHMQLECFFVQERAAFYMAELVLALEHLHKNLGVVYRDLKPENCLLDSEGHLLLTDFGLSKVALDGESCATVAGTVEYMAPEVVQGKKYGFAVDWWSLGALGFDLMTGNPPFRGNNKNIIMQNIVHGKLKLPYHLSSETKDLLTRLLRKEPKKRLGYGPRDIQTIKSHRFFKNIDWAALGRREVSPPIVPFINDPELAENFSSEFTNLPLSPVVERGNWGSREDLNPANVFNGFSYVASQSLLDGFSGHSRGGLRRAGDDDEDDEDADEESLVEKDDDGWGDVTGRGQRADSVASMISL
ncbi:AGC/RSK protein kinase [Pseudogymnoascus sp. 05NY08]|nr:AGC/RSK protein kinase [Pseudogymnoascus sp. 05NY08]